MMTSQAATIVAKTISRRVLSRMTVRKSIVPAASQSHQQQQQQIMPKQYFTTNGNNHTSPTAVPIIMDIQDESDIQELAKQEVEAAAKKKDENLSYQTLAADRATQLHTDRDLHHHHQEKKKSDEEAINEMLEKDHELQNDKKAKQKVEEDPHNVVITKKPS
jgi:hypothetical protein